MRRYVLSKIGVKKERDRETEKERKKERNRGIMFNYSLHSMSISSQRGLW